MKRSTTSEIESRGGDRSSKLLLRTKKRGDCLPERPEKRSAGEGDLDSYKVLARTGQVREEYKALGEGKTNMKGCQEETAEKPS